MHSLMTVDYIGSCSCRKELLYPFFKLSILTATLKVLVHAADIAGANPA